MSRAQERESPAGTGLHGNELISSCEYTPRAVVVSAGALLRTWAGFIDEVLIALCKGRAVSLAGRKCLAHAADRMREIAEALQ